MWLFLQTTMSPLRFSSTKVDPSCECRSARCFVRGEDSLLQCSDCLEAWQWGQCCAVRRKRQEIQQMCKYRMSCRLRRPSYVYWHSLQKKAPESGFFFPCRGVFHLQRKCPESRLLTGDLNRICPSEWHIMLRSVVLLYIISSFPSLPLAMKTWDGRQPGCPWWLCVCCFSHSHRGQRTNMSKCTCFVV